MRILFRVMFFGLAWTMGMTMLILVLVGVCVADILSKD